MRSDTVRAKVSHETKMSAERVLSKLGLSMSEAINLMLIQVSMQKGLPFEISLPKVPNAETAKVLKETDEGKGLVECKDIDDLFDKVGI
jgi:DNA-damage-inducible protein J